MSKKAEKAPQELMGDTRGIKEIPDTLRRGARMSPNQLHWSLFAAGALIVTEAGGTFVSLGHDQPYFDGACGILAANPLCVRQALDILSKEQ